MLTLIYKYTLKENVMAKNTSISLRDKTIYQVFPRQFSKTHDLKGVTEKFNLIKKLNVDYLYLLPIHPIGKVNRKGTYGSPYSITNYYEINPDLGDLEDFKTLVKEAHQRGLGVIIDIVFNHTAHDAVYTKTHPEWYYRKADGSFTNRVGDWWDIIDLKFEGNPDLETELINVLLFWTKLGVDGIRADVASLVPLDFWKKARAEIEKINPNFIFLAESVHLHFIKYLRDLGYEAYSDSQVYQVFDICYDYDIFDEFINYFKNDEPLQKWVDSLIRQEAIYPKNYIKLRFLENHDQERIGKYLKTESQFRNLNTLLFFLKGTQMIYNGQECGATKRPDLFELDEIDWSTYNKAGLVELICKMNKLKKSLHYLNGVMNIEVLNADCLLFRYDLADKTVIGIFNLSSEEREIDLKYAGIDYLSEKTIKKGLQKIVEPLVLILEK